MLHTNILYNALNTVLHDNDNNWPKKSIYLMICIDLGISIYLTIHDMCLDN